MWIPVVGTWRLNECHYGALQGLNKKEATAQLGAEQGKLSRRSYDEPPPALKLNDPRSTTAMTPSMPASIPRISRPRSVSRTPSSARGRMHRRTSGQPSGTRW